MWAMNVKGEEKKKGEGGVEYTQSDLGDRTPVTGNLKIILSSEEDTKRVGIQPSGGKALAFPGSKGSRGEERGY